MLPCAARSLRTELRSVSIHHLQPLNSTQPRPFLYPRWYAHLSPIGEHVWTSQEPSTLAAGAADGADLLDPTEAPGIRRTGSSGLIHQSRVAAARNIVNKRIDRLPRSKLEARSSLELSLLAKILATPTFKTARKDVETIFEEIKTQESAHKAAHRSRMRRLYGPNRVDWVPIAAQLTSVNGVVSQPALDKILELRDVFLDEHAGNVPSNMWIQKSGTGVAVYLLPRVQSSHNMRSVALQGSPRSIELAEKSLRLLQETFLLSGGKRRKKDGLGLQMGTISSVRSFSHYVSCLVQHKKPRQAQQEAGETNHERVAAALVRVFLDPAASKYASSYALDRALAYICQYDELEATAKTLHERATRLGLRIEIGSFNHLIKQAISRNNEVRVRSLVADMHDAGVSANGPTWALFFAASCSNQARQALLSDMIRSVTDQAERDGLSRKLASDMAAHHIANTEDSPEGVSNVLHKLDEIFGTSWLNSTVYHRMVQAVNQRRNNKLKNITSMLLQLPSQRGLQSSTQIEVSRFALHRHQLNAEDCIVDLLAILEKKEIAIHEMHIGYTFMAAWDRMWPNVCRVLWRHAASHGNIFHTMQSVVNTSLLNNTSGSKYINDIWKRFAGSIIAGTDTDMTGFATIFPRLSKHCSNLTNPMEWLVTYTPDDGTRDEQLSLAYLIMSRDLEAWKRQRPMTHEELHPLLTLARQVDLEWKNDKLLMKLPISELLDRAVAVPLERRMSAVETENDVIRGEELLQLRLPNVAASDLDQAFADLHRLPQSPISRNSK